MIRFVVDRLRVGDFDYFVGYNLELDWDSIIADTQPFVERDIWGEDIFEVEGGSREALEVWGEYHRRRYERTTVLCALRRIEGDE